MNGYLINECVRLSKELKNLADKDLNFNILQVTQYDVRLYHTLFLEVFKDFEKEKHRDKVMLTAIKDGVTFWTLVDAEILDEYERRYLGNNDKRVQNLWREIVRYGEIEIISDTLDETGCTTVRRCELGDKEYMVIMRNGIVRKIEEIQVLKNN